jgi:hypothetical protein
MLMDSIWGDREAFPASCLNAALFAARPAAHCKHAAEKPDSTAAIVVLATRAPL